MQRIRGSVASLIVHTCLLALAFSLTRLRPDQAVAPPPARPHTNLVFLSMPEIGGGGHTGGDRTPVARQAPPKQAPAPTPRPTEVEPVTPPPLEAAPLVAQTTPLVGTVEASSTTATTQGPGEGPGATSGKSGTGQGPGAGPGEGPGNYGYRIGNGVSAPKLVRSVSPQYTPDAMRAHISGSVWLECIVDARGQVDRCRLSRSLDPNFGLDEEAIKAARQWKFEPGIKSGEPVPVQVTIELAFSLR